MRKVSTVFACTRMIYRFLFTTTLTVFAVISLATEIAHAEPGICKRLADISSVDPDKSPYFQHRTREERCRLHYWSKLRPLPLSKILNEAERAQYEEAIAKQDCDAAAALLSKRFVEAHPDAPSILENESDYSDWELATVVGYFPKLALCLNLKAIREAQREIDRLGLTAAPYAGHQKSVLSKYGKELPWPIYQRHGAVSNIIIRVTHKFDPVTALGLLKLSVAGRAVKHHELLELYLAYRLHYSGLQDPIIQQVIDRPLDNQLKADIERKARLKLFPYDIPEYPD